MSSPQAAEFLPPKLAGVAREAVSGRCRALLRLLLCLVLRLPRRSPPLIMEPAACKHLIDLPDELLQQIMLATSVQGVVACARVCRMWASLVRSEELWEALCVASWPLVHRLPRSAYSSWRLCHRSRCSGTPPGTWQKLLPLYDESAVLASERPGGWIGRLGATLLRIRSVRKLHGLHNWPRVGARGSRAGVSQACNEEEGLSWLHSVHEALSRPQAAHELPNPKPTPKPKPKPKPSPDPKPRGALPQNSPCVTWSAPR